MAVWLRFIQGLEELNLLESDLLRPDGVFDNGDSVTISLTIARHGSGQTWRDAANQVRAIEAWLRRVEDRAQFGTPGTPVYLEYEPRMGSLPRPTYGPGPMRKRILPGSIVTKPDNFQSGKLLSNFIDPLTITLRTERYWTGAAVTLADAKGGVLAGSNGGIVIPGAAALTNLVTNPSFEVNATDFWTVATNCARAREEGGPVGVAGLTGRTCCRVTRTATGSAAWLSNATGTSGMAVSADTGYAFSAWVYLPTNFVGACRLRITWYTAAGASISSSDGTNVTAANAWQKTTLRATSPATAAFATALLYFASSSAAVGQWALFDAASFIGAGEATPYPYFDGDSGPGFAWSGTAHNSTSTADAADLTVPSAGILTKEQGTVECWYKPAYSTSEGGLFENGLFAAVVDNDNMLTLYYDCANTRFEATMEVATTAQQATATATLTRETWAHVVMTWKAGELQVYANGAAGSSNALTTGVLTSLPSYFRLGMGFGGLAGRGECVYRIWTDCLTATQVAELYAYGRPVGETPFAWTVAADGVIKNHDDSTSGNDNWIYANGIPGDMPAPLRLQAKLTSATALEKLRLAVRATGARSATLFQAESASSTYDAETSSSADANASGGSKARTAAASTTATTRFSLTIVSNPGELVDWAGQWRVFARVYDGAAATEIFSVQMRPVMAGVTGDWSDAVSAPAVGQWNLIELGVIDIPLFAITEDAMTRFREKTYGSGFYTLGFRVTKASGGTVNFDTDYILLMPVEQEGALSKVSGTWDQNDYALLDFTGDRAVAMILSDNVPQEWAANWAYEGDILHMLPGRPNRLTLHFNRASQVDNIADTVDVVLKALPRYRNLR